LPDQSAALPHKHGTLYVVLLAVLIGLSLMDRQILSIIAEPLKREFKLTDTQLGLLSGTIFALVFAFASIPIAWAADRYSRTRILAVCATSWALCTMAMGAASGYLQLAATRMGLALGEAGCNPCAQSLIADYVPVERRNRAMAIYVMGGPAGVISAGIFGGMLTDAYGWRVALYVLGGISLAVALFAAFILPEPRRKTASPAATDTGGFLALTRKPAFRYIIAATGLASIAIYGGLVWGTVFVVRYFGWTEGQAGAVFGTIGAVVALGGSWLGGPLADYLSRRDKRWQMWLPAVVIIASIPFSVVAVFAPTILVLIIASSSEAFCRTLSFAPLAAALQRLAPDNARARAAATAGVTGTLVGMGLGPTIVGALSDGLASWAGADSLRYGLLAMVIPQALAGWCCWRAAKTIDKDFVD
jgi:MFS transporter, Spinster family, sphingosine-1-phosphate transporter